MEIFWQPGGRGSAGKHAAGARMGQTFLELIVAIFIILTALGAIATLVFVSLRGQAQSEESVIAYNLAREALEVVRSLRDNTFTSGFWDASNCTDECTLLRAGPSATLKHLAIVQFDALNVFNPAWYLAYSNDYTITSPQASVCLNTAANVVFPYSSFLQYKNGCPAGTIETGKYRRVVTLDFICLNATHQECVEAESTQFCGQAGGNCDVTYDRFGGHRVTVQVRVTSRGGPRDIILQDYLYAWK